MSGGEFDHTAEKLCERACSRRGRHHQHLRSLTHRFREQARSHRGRCRSLHPIHPVQTKPNLRLSKPSMIILTI
ncbi:hypothetical protein C2E19_18090 [Pseudomonas sp. DTU12.3]|nr:hypothetical protein C2E19_18090 [Pseudomonas sp. DTU12.3]